MISPKRCIAHLLFLFLFCPLFAGAQAAAIDPAETAHVQELIKSLPEVKALDHVFDSVSNRRQRVKMRVLPPEGSRTMYKVEVGYQGSNRFEPHYYFYVAPETDDIWVEDLQHGDRPTLSVWRERRQSGDDIPENGAVAPAGTDSASTPSPPDAQLVYP